MSDSELKNLIFRLKRHNSWRRGEMELSKEDLNPEQIGKDLDSAVEILEFELLRRDVNKNIKTQSPNFITIKEYYF